MPALRLIRLLMAVGLLSLSLGLTGPGALAAPVAPHDGYAAGCAGGPMTDHGGCLSVCRLGLCAVVPSSVDVASPVVQPAPAITRSPETRTVGRRTGPEPPPPRGDPDGYRNN